MCVFFGAGLAFFKGTYAEVALQLEAMIRVGATSARSGQMQSLMKNLAQSSGTAASTGQDSNSLSEVSWRGHTKSVTEEKLQRAILACRATLSELEKTSGHDAVMAAYDELFVKYSDAITVVDDLMAGLRKNAEGNDAKMEELEPKLDNLRFFWAYLANARIERTIERTKRMVTNMKAEMKAGKGGTAEGLAMLHEMILGNMEEIAGLEYLEGDNEWSTMWTARQLVSSVAARTV